MNSIAFFWNPKRELAMNESAERRRNRSNDAFNLLLSRSLKHHDNTSSQTLGNGLLQNFKGVLTFGFLGPLTAAVSIGLSDKRGSTNKISSSDDIIGSNAGNNELTAETMPNIDRRDYAVDQSNGLTYDISQEWRDSTLLRFRDMAARVLRSGEVRAEMMESNRGQTSPSDGIAGAANNNDAQVKEALNKTSEKDEGDKSKENQAKKVEKSEHENSSKESHNKLNEKVAERVSQVAQSKDGNKAPKTDDASNESETDNMPKSEAAPKTDSEKVKGRSMGNGSNAVADEEQVPAKSDQNRLTGGLEISEKAAKKKVLFKDTGSEKVASEGSKSDQNKLKGGSEISEKAAKKRVVFKDTGSEKVASEDSKSGKIASEGIKTDKSTVDAKTEKVVPEGTDKLACEVNKHGGVVSEDPKAGNLAPEGIKTEPVVSEGTKKITSVGTKFKVIASDGTEAEKDSSESTKNAKVVPEGTKSEKVAFKGTEVKKYASEGLNSERTKTGNLPEATRNEPDGEIRPSEQKIQSEKHECVAPDGIRQSAGTKKTETISAPKESEAPSQEIISSAENTTVQEKTDSAKNQEFPTDFKLATVRPDPRFQQQNVTLWCYTMFVDFHRCRYLLGEQDSACTFFEKSYKSLCPNAWVQKWTDQMERGVFPMDIRAGAARPCPRPKKTMPGCSIADQAQ